MVAWAMWLLWAAVASAQTGSDLFFASDGEYYAKSLLADQMTTEAAASMISEVMKCRVGVGDGFFDGSLYMEFEGAANLLLPIVGSGRVSESVSIHGGGLLSITETGEDLDSSIGMGAVAFAGASLDNLGPLPLVIAGGLRLERYPSDEDIEEARTGEIRLEDPSKPLQFSRVVPYLITRAPISESINPQVDAHFDARQRRLARIGAAVAAGFVDYGVFMVPGVASMDFLGGRRTDATLSLAWVPAFGDMPQVTAETFTGREIGVVLRSGSVSEVAGTDAGELGIVVDEEGFSYLSVEGHFIGVVGLSQVVETGETGLRLGIDALASGEDGEGLGFAFTYQKNWVLSSLYGPIVSGRGLYMNVYAGF